MYKVFSFSLVSITIKFFVGFVLTKLFALFLGPSGIAVLGNMKSVMQILMSSSSFGMQRGIIRFTSEFREQRHAFQKLLGTAHIIYGLIALVIAVVLFFLSDYFAAAILQDDKYAWLFQILAIIVPFQGFHVLYFSILQGLDNYKKVVWVELIMIFCNLIFVGVSTFKFGLTGALFAVACIPVFYFFVSAFFLKSDIPNFKIAWSSSTAKNLFLYALMTLFSGIAFPLLFILIRNHISSVLGMDEVGYWEAINQFSFFYFILLNSVMLMYVLPKITAQTDNMFYRSQVVEYLKKIMPLFALFLITLFLLRKYAILALLSPEFSSIEILFGWQLLGDFFRALTLIFSIYFHARRMAIPYIIIDALLFVLMLTLTTVFVDSYGLLGAVKAHFISYFIYFIVTVFWLRKTLFSANDAINV
ncbi:MAG: O-antigen translocase [Flavobacteriaceae bacterium]|nr:O-antigen translocase [Flavobacteriaceae bacterium]MDG2289760.1 O-antigen translocase [Flavobacteriaceae bacterium]